MRHTTPDWYVVGLLNKGNYLGLVSLMATRWLTSFQTAHGNLKNLWEDLTGFSHIHHADGLNHTLLSLTLFQILGDRFQEFTIEYDICYGFFINALYYVKKICWPYSSLFLLLHYLFSKFSYHEKNARFLKGSFLHQFRWSCVCFFFILLM